jgi:hypothetical protein
MCWSYQSTIVLQERKGKSWWTICIVDFDIDTWSTSSTHFILTPNKKMWAYKQALYICWFLSISYWNPSFQKEKIFEYHNETMFSMSDFKKINVMLLP